MRQVRVKDGPRSPTEYMFQLPTSRPTWRAHQNTEYRYLANTTVDPSGASCWGSPQNRPGSASLICGQLQGE